MIVNEEQRRAMEFIVAANRGGYRPTGREVNQWRLAPGPKPMRKGKVLRAQGPAVPERRVRKNPTAFSTWLASQGLYQNSTYDALKLVSESLLGINRALAL